MKVIVEKSYRKSFWKLERWTQIKVHEKLKSLEFRPNIPNVKKLTNFSPNLRLRVWDYRILFDIVDDEVIVSDVKHRKDIYK